MAKRDRNVIKSKAEYTRAYENMCGVGTESRGEVRLAYTENMYVDREGDGEAIESIPGFRKIFSFGEEINGIHLQKLGTGLEYVLVHAGDKLYRFPSSSYAALTSLSPIATMADCPSNSFTLESCTYILDGESITEINESGRVRRLIGGEDENCYTPLTYVNGKPYEKRNILSTRFREELYIEYPDDYSFGTKGLTYEKTGRGECWVSGADPSVGGVVYIPKYTVIDGEKHAVTGVSAGAFYGNSTITELIVSSGVLELGACAFFGTTALKRVVLSDTVKSFGEYCFAYCSVLEYILLGKGLEGFPTAAFGGDFELKTIGYAGSMEMFKFVKGKDVIGNIPVEYNVEYTAIRVAIPIASAAKSVTRVELDGEEIDFEFDQSASEAVVDFDDRAYISDRRVSILGILKDEGDFLSTGLGSRVSPGRAITGCTLSEVFDGRVFLSGNYDVPGAVFYSGTTADGRLDPTYFPGDCYFVDGVADYNVVSILTTGKCIAVFKSDDDGTGSIFLHAPRTYAGKKSYPVVRRHNKVAALCPAFNFLDDSVFLSPLGVTRLRDYTVSLNALVSVSDPINSLLLSEPLVDARMCRFGRYLVVSTGSSMYLADATERFTKGQRSEYDWYYLSGIGTYLDDTRVYRYSELPAEGLDLFPTPGEIAEGVVISYVNGSGEKLYYVEADGKKYRVHPTEQMRGGRFYPATAVAGVGSVLMFGTGCGDLCVFNTDKRGVPPISLSTAEGFDLDEYKRVMGKAIHPDFYSFAGHAPRYAISTPLEGCDPTYLEKRTVPHSTVLKLKCFAKSSLYCEIDHGDGYESYGPLHPTGVSFDELCFGGLGLTGRKTVHLTLNDRSCGWCEKQIRLYSEEFASPFGVYSIAYRYKIKGKVSKTNS